MDPASQKLSILLVEDTKKQWEKYRDDFESLKWTVTRAHDSDDAEQRLAEVATKKNNFNVLVIDCEINGISDRGVYLAIKLADLNPNQRILVYTAKPPSDRMDYALIVRKLSSRGVSFMYLSGGDEEEISLEEAIWATWKGFLIFSPTPTHYFPLAIPKEPDPLNQASWDILRALSQVSDERRQVAHDLNTSLPAVKWRINRKIKPILAARIFGAVIAQKMGYFSPDISDDGEFFNHEESKADIVDAQDKNMAFTDKHLIAWYKENRVKYCRE